MDAPVDAPDKWLSFALAFVGGWGDALGFLIAKTFTGHVTGNLVLASIAVASGGWRSFVAHSSAVLCFLLGMPLNALITRLTVRWTTFPTLVVSVSLELVLVLAADLALAIHDAGTVPLLVACLALALGLQNAAFRRAGAISLHTTYLTGTITSLLAPKIERKTLPLIDPTPQESDLKSRLLFGICGAFVLGAIMGAGVVLRSQQLGLLMLGFSLLIILVFCCLQKQPAANSAP